MSLSLAQTEIAKSVARYRVAICGRRFGKTYVATRELCKFASKPDAVVWYIAPTRLQAKALVWEYLKGRLSSMNWIEQTNETDLVLKLVNGATISLKSADAPDRMRGFSVDFVVFDEFADMHHEIWDMVVRPTLSDRGGKALFIGTPKGSTNWSKEIFDKSASNKDWQSFRYTTLDGGRIPQSEIDTAKRELDARTFRQEYEASFEDFAGRIFYAFTTSDNVAEFDGNVADMPLFIGMDFNVNPMTAVIAVIRGEIMHIVDEIVMTSSNTHEMVEEIKNRYPVQCKSNSITIYPDSAGQQRRTSAQGQTDISILQNAGFKVKYYTAHEAVRDGINAVNSRLCNESKVRRLFVSAKCKHSIGALENHCYKENTSIPDKDSGFDHMADAIRYMVSHIYPVKKDTTPSKPRLWGHNLGK